MRTCPECGFANHPEKTKCKRCGADLLAPVIEGPPIPLEDRKAILDSEVSKYAGQGWRVVSRTDTTAQLEMQIPPNGCLGLILLALFIVPGILYFVLYKGTKGLYIEVRQDGRVRAAQS